MFETKYFFQVREVKDKLVDIDKDVLDNQIVGLFLQDSIRFYDTVDEYRVSILKKEMLDKLREIYAHRLDFDVVNGKLKLSAPRSNTFYKLYKIGKKVVYVNTDTFFDIVEYDNLDKYLISIDMDPTKEKEIKTKKTLILSSEYPVNKVHLKSRNNK